MSQVQSSQPAPHPPPTPTIHINSTSSTPITTHPPPQVRRTVRRRLNRRISRAENRLLLLSLPPERGSLKASKRSRFRALQQSICTRLDQLRSNSTLSSVPPEVDGEQHTPVSAPGSTSASCLFSPVCETRALPQAELNAAFRTLEASFQADEPHVVFAPHPLLHGGTSPFLSFTTCEDKVRLFCAASSSRLSVSSLSMATDDDNFEYSSLLPLLSADVDECELSRVDFQSIAALSKHNLDSVQADLLSVLTGEAAGTSDGDHHFDFVDRELSMLSVHQSFFGDMPEPPPACHYSIVRCKMVIAGLERVPVIDSGAGPCFISPECLQYLRKHNALNQRDANIKLFSLPKGHPITSANGEVSLVTEFAMLKVQLSASVTISHPFLVFKGLPEDILIGNDFLRKHKAIIDYSSNSLSFPSFGISTPFVEQKSVERPAPPPCALLTSTAITIPPFHEAKVGVYSPSSASANVCFGLTSSLPHALGTLGIATAKCLSPLRRGRTDVLLMNTSESDVYLPAGSSVCCFEPLNTSAYEFYRVDLDLDAQHTEGGSSPPELSSSQSLLSVRCRSGC